MISRHADDERYATSLNVAIRYALLRCYLYDFAFARCAFSRYAARPSLLLRLRNSHTSSSQPQRHAFKTERRVKFFSMLCLYIPHKIQAPGR